MEILLPGVREKLRRKSGASGQLEEIFLSLTVNGK
jgi:hypothetical protein